MNLTRFLQTLCFRFQKEPKSKFLNYDLKRKKAQRSIMTDREFVLLLLKENPSLASQTNIRKKLTVRMRNSQKVHT